MSLTFESVLRRIFDNVNNLENKKYVGRAFYASIDNKMKFKAELISSSVMDHYDTLRIRILHRDEGELDATSLRFNEIWGKLQVPGNPNFPGGVNPHLWFNREKLEWYSGVPNDNHYKMIVRQVTDYIDVFKEETLEKGKDSHLSLDKQINSAEASKTNVNNNVSSQTVVREER